MHVVNHKLRTMDYLIFPKLMFLPSKQPKTGINFFLPAKESRHIDARTAQLQNYIVD